MRGCGSAILTAVIGAVVGAIVISVLGWQMMASGNPDFAKDAQSGMVFLLTIPAGALLGAAIGFGYGWWRGNRGG